MQLNKPIAIALILLVVILLVIFLVMPEYQTLTDLRDKLGQKMSQRVSQVDYYATISKLYENIQAKAKDIQKIDNALPQNPSLGKTFYFLQNSAQENGLAVKSIFLSKAGATNTTFKSIKDLSFSMNVSGDYNSLKNFIIFLEKSSRIFEVTNISFSSGTKPPYDFSLQLVTHSY